MFSRLFGSKGEDAARSEPRVNESLKAEARANPGGWVYEIGGGYNAAEAAPPQAIRGAWKVDERGEIVGDFIPNPKFDPEFRKPG